MCGRTKMPLGQSRPAVALGMAERKPNFRASWLAAHTTPRCVGGALSRHGEPPRCPPLPQTTGQLRYRVQESDQRGEEGWFKMNVSVMGLGIIGSAWVKNRCPQAYPITRQTPAIA